MRSQYIEQHKIFQIKTVEEEIEKNITLITAKWHQYICNIHTLTHTRPYNMKFYTKLMVVLEGK